MGGCLSIGVKSEKKNSAEVETEHKVKIGYSPGAGGSGGKKRKNELSLDYTFTCSCSATASKQGYSSYRSGDPPRSPICKHIGACLIVHFH